jgi:heme/copper-type cytochrome/quinol oxidase subunit 2
MENLTARLLLLSNVPPLIGLLFYGWGIKEGVLLYWLETIVIGLFSILKTSIAKASPDAIDWLSKYGKTVLLLYKLFITFLVTILVGAYALVTGVVVGFMMFLIDYGFHEFPEGITPPEYLYSQISTRKIWIALAIICLSHAVSFLVNFIIRKEYRKNQDREQLEILGGRVGAIVLPVVPCMIIFAIIVSMEGLISQGTMTLLRKGPAALLIISKTYFDYHSHRKEHDSKIT